MSTKKRSQFTPARIILGSIIFTISLGTLLLALPASRTAYIPLLDLFFTATSATCVTGLLTIPLNSFTAFGHFIILLLIQIGGLGLITMTIFLMSLFIELGFATQLMAGQVLELESWKNIKKIILFIISFTFIGESLGTLATFISIYKLYPTHTALWYSLFHGISSFCSAGFTLFPYGLEQFKLNSPMLFNTIILMVVGGLGFITWHEIFLYIQSLHKKKRFVLSLHSKIVLFTTAALIIASFVIYYLLEHNNTLRHMSLFNTLLNTLFNTTSARSTGFTTAHVNELQYASLLLIMIIAFIGSSPGSTGSGIKTTTFAVFIATIKSAVTRKTSVELLGRKIAIDQVHKALAVVSLSLAWIVFTTFCLLITERTWTFLDILFEVFSAFATLGLSTGVTPYLSMTGKIFIIITMIIGRIGSLTMLIALRKKHESIDFTYPEERVMLG